MLKKEDVLGCVAVFKDGTRGIITRHFSDSNKLVVRSHDYGVIDLDVAEDGAVVIDNNDKSSHFVIEKIYLPDLPCCGISPGVDKLLDSSFRLESQIWPVPRKMTKTDIERELGYAIEIVQK